MTQTPAATPAPSTAEEALATAADDASLARSIARSAQIEADLDVNPGRYRTSPIPRTSSRASAVRPVLLPRSAIPASSQSSTRGCSTTRATSSWI